MKKEKSLPIFAKLYCNWCEKYIDSGEVKVDTNISGDSIFSHHENHLLGIDLTTITNGYEYSANTEKELDKLDPKDK